MTTDDVQTALDAIAARRGDWYGNGNTSTGVWDEPLVEELNPFATVRQLSMGHQMVRNDVPALLYALRAVSDFADGCENVARTHADAATRDTHRAIAADLRGILSTSLAEVTR